MKYSSVRKIIFSIFVLFVWWHFVRRIHLIPFFAFRSKNFSNTHFKVLLTMIINSKSVSLVGKHSQNTNKWFVFLQIHSISQYHSNIRRMKMVNWKSLFHQFASVSVKFPSTDQVIHLFFNIIQGTHWIRITNDESDSFALLPIFAFDDDYVPLSPVATPSPNDKFILNPNSNNNNTTDSFSLVRELAAIHEVTENSSSVSATQTQRQPSPEKEQTSQVVPTNGREDSPVSIEEPSTKVEVLDIADLIDPGVRITSKFSLKDSTDEFKVQIHGKLQTNRF